MNTEGKAAFFSALRPEDFAVLAKEFRGEIYRGSWSPMPIERSRDRGNKRRPLADIASGNYEATRARRAKAAATR